jgi:hypothetical protein
MQGGAEVIFTTVHEASSKDATRRRAIGGSLGRAVQQISTTRGRLLLRQARAGDP